VAPPPSPGKAAPKGMAGRLTAKVGPLPVWAWAAVALVVGYYVYKRSSSSSASTTTPATTDTSTTTPSTTDTSGTPTTDTTDTTTDSGLSTLDSSLLALLGQESDSLASAITATSANKASGPASGGPPSSSSPNGPAASPSPTGDQKSPSGVSPWGPATAVSGVPAGFIVTSAGGGVAVNAPVQQALAAPPKIPQKTPKYGAN
jgi:hypothetical protein